MPKETVKSSELREKTIWRISIFLAVIGLVHYARFPLYKSIERERNYRDAVRRRELKITETQEIAKFQKTPDIWFLYEPLWACPDLELVGNFHDGIKWVCGLRRMRKGCIVYSFGSNGDDQFETDIMKKTECKVYTFDPTLTLEKKRMLSSSVRKNFHNIGLATHDGVLAIGGIEREVRNLRTIMKGLKHKQVDILKLDIEGAEYEVFEELYSSGFPDVRQILVEVHAFKHLQELNKSGNVVQIPSKLRLKVDRLFQVLEAAGFRLFHKEINVLWSRPQYSNMGVEYAFLRASR